MHKLRQKLTFSLIVFGFPMWLGCDGQQAVGPRSPVSGKVTFADDPLEKGVVIFTRAASDNEPGLEARGEITHTGTYELRTPDGKEGLPAGTYSVAVVSSEPSDPNDEYSVPKSLIPTKYNDPTKSGIKVQVSETPEPGQYDIKLRK